jgi:hypothetical protein
MSTQNDISRQASLFTMNGLVDPRMLHDAVARKVSTRSNADALTVWRTFVQRLFGRMTKGNAGL